MKRKFLSAKGGKPRTWLITALLASAALAYVFCIFLPLQLGISSIRSELNEREQHIVQAKQLAAPLEQAAIRLASTQQISEKWQAAAPSNRDVAMQLARLTEEARSAGVNIGRLDPQPPIEQQVLTQYGVAVQLQGSFEQVFDFLARIESMPATIWVRSIQLSLDENTGVLSGDLTLTIFGDRIDYSN